MKNLMRLATLMMLVAVTMTSCSSDDDDNDNKLSAAQQVAGTYVGNSSVAFKYSNEPMEYENETLTITGNTNNTLNVKLVNDTWGSFEAKNMTVVLSGSTYTFQGEATVSMGMSEEEKKDYAFTVTGTINATSKVANVIFSVPTVMGGTTLTYTSVSVK